jgi:hypothetical protein
VTVVNATQTDTRLATGSFQVVHNYLDLLETSPKKHSEGKEYLKPGVEEVIAALSILSLC